MLAINAVACLPIYLLNRVWWLGVVETYSPSLPFSLSRSMYMGGIQLVLIVFLAQALLWMSGYRFAFSGFVDGLLRALFSPIRVMAVVAVLCLFALPGIQWVTPVVSPVTLFSCALASLHYLGRRFSGTPLRAPSVRTMGWTVFALVLLLHLIPWTRVTLPLLDTGSRDYLFTGDQPGYLYMAESLIQDGNLDVGPTVLPDRVYHLLVGKHAGGPLRHNPGLRRGSPEHRALEERYQGAVYSTHRPGTSVFVLPAYAVGTWIGDHHRAAVCLLLVLLIAWAAREIALTARQLTGAPWTSLVLGSVVGISAPVAVSSTAIYPETIMFFVMARLLRLTVEHRLDWHRNVEIAFWFSLSPWLQDKYGVWTLPFALVRMYFVLPYWRRLLLPAIPFVVSALLMLDMNFLLYGRILPSNSLGAFLPFHEAIITGLPGIWFDWGYGIAMLAPFSFLVVAGFGAWMRSSAARGPSHQCTLWASIIALAVGCWVIGTWNHWWGGFSPGSRFMLSLLPLIAVPAIVATTRLPGLARTTAWLLWILSAALGLDAILHPATWYARQLPSAVVAAVTGWDAFSVRYWPFNREPIIMILPGALVGAIAGCLAMAYFAWACVCPVTNVREKNGRCCAQRGLAVAMLVAVGLTISLGHQGDRERQLTLRDVPVEVGLLKEPTLVSLDLDTWKLFTLLYYREWPGSFAFAVHYLDADRRMIGQDDFDLTLYRNELFQESPALATRVRRSRELPIEYVLRPPTDAVAVHIGVYDPALRKNYRNQLRTGAHILPLRE